jgi:hypothetical protein
MASWTRPPRWAGWLWQGIARIRLPMGFAEALAGRAFRDLTYSTMRSLGDTTAYMSPRPQRALPLEDMVYSRPVVRALTPRVGSDAMPLAGASSEASGAVNHPLAEDPKVKVQAFETGGTLRDASRTARQCVECVAAAGVRNPLARLEGPDAQCSAQWSTEAPSSSSCRATRNPGVATSVATRAETVVCRSALRTQAWDVSLRRRDGQRGIRLPAGQPGDCRKSAI